VYRVTGCTSELLQYHSAVEALVHVVADMASFCIVMITLILISSIGWKTYLMYVVRAHGIPAPHAAAPMLDVAIQQRTAS
jgi:hypothetical protein